MFKDKMQIIVNEDYSWEHDVNLQVEYVNPVHLSNRTIFYANMYNTVASRLTVSLEELAVAKAARLLAHTVLQDFEIQLLADNPPNSSERSPAPLLQAYILKTAKAGNEYALYMELKAALAVAEEKIIKTTMKVEVNRNHLNVIEQYCVQIQTNLSFVKAEQRQARNYT